jgi:hypothetical protein
MTDYNFTIKLHPYGTAPDVGIVEIDPAALYGYFERKDGSEGGGLWFDRAEGDTLELVDYDGVSCLSPKVIAALRAAGVTVDADFE